MREGWVTKLLGDISLVGAGNPAPQDKALFVGGSYPFFRTSDVGRIHIGTVVESEDKLNEKGIKRLTLHPVGTILIPKSGASTFLDHRVLMGVDGYVSSHLATVRAKPEIVDTKYLFYYMLTVEARSLGVDTAYPTLSLSQLNAIKVELPELPEQRRIVAILDEAFAGLATVIANAEKNLANVRELFDSVSKSLLQARNESWKRLTLEVLLERGWVVSHLDGNHGNDYPRKDEFVSSGVPYLSANCLENDEVDISLAKFLSPERAALLRKGIARNNDVLFAHNATVGPVAMLYTDEPKVILSTSLTYYRCHPDHVLPEYLAHYMRSPEFKEQYEAVMRQSTRNQVPITKQREFFHVIPPMTEQRRIAQKLDSLRAEVTRLVTIYNLRLAHVSDLKHSILQRAFSGELTSPPSQAIQEAAE